MNKPQNPQQSKTHTRLFSYTEQEEIRIERAKKEAADFMESFGKGRRPQMINRDNYL